MQDIQPKHVIEAALLAAEAPMPMASLRTLFNDEIDKPAMLAMLEELQADWKDRGVRLAETATGWRFQTAPEMALFLERLNPERPARYSRAVMETLAIIAYRQPVTRGDIEDIRGVTVSSQVVKSLEDRGWIEVIGHKDVLGRPALLGTTRKFLDDLGLSSIGDLPELNTAAGMTEMGDALEQQVIPFPPSDGTDPVISDGQIESPTPFAAQVQTDLLPPAAADPAPELELPLTENLLATPTQEVLDESERPVGPESQA